MLTGYTRYRSDAALPCAASSLRAVARGCAGFTLIEILIAMLVMAIGLLGVAALQTSAIQFNRGAHLRSQATSLAYDIADRMRANRDAALAGAYDVAFGDTPPTCTAAEGDTVAERDVASWRNAIACVLPMGNGRIQVQNGVVTIGVTWDESRGEGQAELFEMATGL